MTFLWVEGIASFYTESQSYGIANVKVILALFHRNLGAKAAMVAKHRTFMVMCSVCSALLQQLSLANGATYKTLKGDTATPGENEPPGRPNCVPANPNT
jgi:hypothetical protein